MNKYRVVDADAHFIEPEIVWREYLEPEFRPMGPRKVVDSEGRKRTLIGDQLAPSSEFAYADTPKERLAAMDKEGIDAAVMYPTVGLYMAGLQRIDLYAALCRAYNNWASDYCRASPSRLFAPAMLPQSDIFESVKEARRGITQLGLKGAFLRPNPIGGRNFDHPAWVPLWNLLEELDAPLVIHEGTSGNVPQIGLDRFESYLYRHAASHPMEHMLAMMTLICGGVLERHPKLRVVHVEAGCGWVPYWLERLDHHVADQAARKGGGPRHALKPSEYFKRQVVVSADPEENILAAVVSTIGDDNIAFSTDYPHPDHAFEGMVKKCAERPELTDESKRKILGANAARAFGI